MKFWIRDGSVQVGPYKYKMSELAYEFEVPFYNDETLATANILIYNLSAKTRKTIEEKKGLPLILNAGYENNTGTVFVGEIIQAASTKKNLNWETKILATEAVELWLRKEVNKTYKLEITSKEILEDLLRIFGLEVSKFELAQNITYKRGKVCKGFLRDVFQEIVETDCKSIFQVKNNQIFIKDPSKSEPYALLLTPGTGLLDNRQNKTTAEITKPQETTETSEEKEQKNKSFITRSCLLKYDIGSGDTIRFLSEDLKGDYKVINGSHKGSRSKEWATTVEVEPI